MKRQPPPLWELSDPPPLVELYIDAHAGEFDIGWLCSEYPYSGPASNRFCRLSARDPRPHLATFDGLGAGGWRALSERPLNSLTADLLATADHLGGGARRQTTSAGPWRIGLDTTQIWIPLFDGGLGLDFQIYEDEYTNRVSARQRTVIRGPMTYRILLELLEFSWCSRRLPGETDLPSRDGIHSAIEAAVPRT